MAQGGGPGDLIGAVHVDYRGTRYVLGRTAEAYAIWDARGGAPIQTHPLSDEGWAAAWQEYQRLEATAAWTTPAAAAGPAGTPGAVPGGAEQSVIDYPGGRYGLGRAQGQYVIWDLQQRTGVRSFPMTDEGWAQAWPAFQELERPYSFVPTAMWERGRPIPIRAMRAGQIIGGAFKLYFMHFWKLVGLVAVVVVPVTLLTGTLTVLTLEPVSTATPFGASQAFQNPPWVSVITAVVSVLVVPFLTAAVLGALAEAFIGREVSMGRAFRLGYRRAFPVLWVSILVALATLVFFIPAFVVLIIALVRGDLTLLPLYAILVFAGLVPAIFVAFKLLFGTASVVIENRRGVAALRRSWDLVRGLWWKVFGNFLLMALIVAGILFVAFLIVGIIVGIALLDEALTFSTTDPVGLDEIRTVFIVVNAVTAVFQSLTLPLMNLAIVLLYFDARVRKEGFSEEALAREWEAASAGSPTPGLAPPPPAV
jgi:hypothetical protein